MGMCVQRDFGGGSRKGKGSPSLVSYSQMSSGAEVGVVNSFAKSGQGELTPQTAGEKCVFGELDEGQCGQSDECEGQSDKRGG